MKSNSRLGRGLGALIRSESAVSGRPEVLQNLPEVNAVREIPVGSIRPNRYQPRKEFNRDSLDELKASIHENGLVQPVSVRKSEDGSYELVSGERRFRAFSELGFETIPAYVLSVSSNSKMLELALTENVQREDLNPLEIAAGYQRLVDECSLTQEQIAQRVGKNRATVANFLRLLKLPAQVQKSLATGELSMGHARALLGLNNPSELLHLFRKILKDGLNVRQVEARVQQLAEKQHRNPSPRNGETHDLGVKPDVFLSDLLDKMQKRLGTKVKVVRTGSKTGEIKIEYYSEADLGRLIELILGGNNE